MQTGFEIVAARPKGLRVEDDPDAPYHESIRQQQPPVNRRNPSAEDKKVRRQMMRSKTATEIPTSAWQLNPGDAIRGPNNSTVKVQRVRNHKSDSSMVMVDTSEGTLEVPREHAFSRVPVNSRQQELPGDQGFAGGNTNVLPMSGRGTAPINAPGNGSSGTPHCPVCNSALQMRNAGGNAILVCPRDGYAQQANGLGAQTDPNIIRDRRASMDRKPNQDVKVVVQADLRGKAGECRLCGGDLAVDAVDHSENTVHAHCSECGAEHQVQNVHQQTASKIPTVEVSGLDPYSTPNGHMSALARRAHAVLASTEENQ